MNPFLDRRKFTQSLAACGMVASTRRLYSSPQTIAFQADTSHKDLRKSQLFLDDTWVEESYRLERNWEQAEIYPEPVLRPETAWEGRRLSFFGSVFRDRDEWRMYYNTFDTPRPPLFCMATSKDGIHWERPNLGLVEWGGSKQNNILLMPKPDEFYDGPTVCHDPADTERPYKMMSYGSGGGRPIGEYVAFSKDGIRWDWHPGLVLVTGDRTNLLAERDYRGKYTAYLRASNMMKMYRSRSIYRSQSDDFLHWSEPEVILRPDLLDPPNTELYGMSGFLYSDMYLGMLERWYDNPDVIELQLAWSHNGADWHRPMKRSAFIGPKYPWNQAWNSSANTPPVRVGNQLYFYFGGRSGAHQLEAPQPYGAIGLASLRVDRFCSLKADFQEGLLVTKPMTWPGGDLVLTSTGTRYPLAHPASGGGSLTVEVRDEQNQPIPGFSGENKADFSKPSPEFGENYKPVRWPKDRSINSLGGRPIRLAFYMRDARLYSFRADSSLLSQKG